MAKKRSLISLKGNKKEQRQIGLLGTFQIQVVGSSLVQIEVRSPHLMLESSATVSSSECAPRDRKILTFRKLPHHVSSERKNSRLEYLQFVKLGEGAVSKDTEGSQKKMSSQLKATAHLLCEWGRTT